MSILVITTGGTIGAMPYDNPEAPPEYSTMPAPGLDLVQGAVAAREEVECRTISLEPRDSKLIDQPYRAHILSLILEAPEQSILITHGTDTILTSADYFYAKQQSDAVLAGKTIILTGAMIPLANGPESDGYQNLHFALQQLLPDRNAAGVYIVLSDFIAPDEQEGWAPRLYPFAPGRYHKYYDPADGSRSRIIAV